MASETTPSILKQDSQLDRNLNLNTNALTAQLTGGELILPNEVVCLDSSLSDGEFYLADATSEDLSSGMIAIALEKVTDGSDGRFAIVGTVGGFSGLSVNQPYFLSESTPGAITATPPATIGEFVRVIGYALSATELFLLPGGAWVEVI